MLSKKASQMLDHKSNNEIKRDNLKFRKYVSSSTINDFCETLQTLAPEDLQKEIKFANMGQYSQKQIKMPGSKIAVKLESTIADGLPFLNEFNKSKNQNIKKIDFILFKLMRKYEKYEISSILIPCWFKEHWTLYKVDLIEKTITHYNSYIKLDVANKEFFRNLNSYLINSKVIQKMSEKHEGIKNTNDRYKIVNAQTVQQTNGYDCGLYWMINIYSEFFMLDDRKMILDGLKTRSLIDKYIEQKGKDISLISLFSNKNQRIVLKSSEIKSILSIITK